MSAYYTVELNNGDKVKVDVVHGKGYRKGCDYAQRFTMMSLTFMSSGMCVESVAWCSPEVTFNKRFGRNVAFDRLWPKLRQLSWLTKADRRRLFFALRPEYDTTRRPSIPDRVALINKVLRKTLSGLSHEERISLAKLVYDTNSEEVLDVLPVDELVS